MEKDLEKTKEWSLMRIGQFLAKLEFATGALESEAYLDVIVGTATAARDTFHKKNCATGVPCLHLPVTQ